MSWPPSSKPTYPGGAPTSRETANFSMYSDMSSRTIAFSSSNSSCASALASSVLPTPVGPRKRNAPTGRFAFFTPARERSTASATACTAASWPITRRCSVSASRTSFSRSPSTSFATGTPLQRDTTSAISSAVTSSRRSAVPLRAASRSSCSWRPFSSPGMTPYCSRAASLRSPSETARS